ncbi:MAG: hypothetical protein WCJ95_12800 [Mariniphaga sp.]
MNKIQNGRFFILLVLLACSMMSTAQNEKNFDEFKKAQVKEFATFAEQTQKGFDQYSDSINKEFSDYLRKNWAEFKVFSGVKHDTTPKPNSLPEFNPSVDKIKPRGVPTEIKVQMPEPGEALNILQIPITPFIQKQEPAESPWNIRHYNFYGTNFEFQFDPEMNGSLPSDIHNTTVADFWDRLNKTSYNSLLQQLNDARTEMNLNDWGFYILVKKTSEAINPNKNYSTLLSWFLLTKSGYRLRIAYTDNQVSLMFPSANTIYDTKFFITENIKFYAPDFQENFVQTYAKDFPGATRVFDMNLYSALNIGDKYGAKQFKFTYKNKDYSFSLKYNINSIDFFKDYPLCDLKVYFDAAMSPRAKESVFDALKPVVNGLSTADAVNFLLCFVQNGFAYKNDLDQFGKEKFDFPEEDFYYPYTDCDDRAVLFSYLVKELLGLKVIGLVYPGHVATAVNFPGNEAGDYVHYKDDKYVIADPTFINAPFGITMAGMNNAKAEIIEQMNVQNKGAEFASVWDKVNNGGCFAGDNRQNAAIDDEGNSYLTGYFKGYADLGGAILTSKDSTEDVFVAKYNKAGNLLWAVKGTDDGIGRGCNIRLGPDGYVYVGGTFEKLMAFGAFNIIFPKNKSGFFLLKLNKGGEVQWLKQVDFGNIGKNSDVILYSRFSAAGDQLKSEVYPFDPNYEDYGIKFDGSGDVYYSNCISAFSGFKVNNIALGAETGFDAIGTLKDETEKQLSSNCDRFIAGLFGAISLIRLNNFSLSGKTVQQAFDKYNPGFKMKAPKLFELLGRLSLIKNSNGIITVQTGNQKSAVFDKIKIADGTKFKITFLPTGDARIDILNGVKVGKAIIWFTLNYIRVYRVTGNILFDYDLDHSQITMNVQKDMLF